MRTRSALNNEKDEKPLRKTTKRRLSRTRALYPLYYTRSCKAKFHDLPDEIIVKIFLFLPHDELYQNVRQVCSRWRNLCLNPNVWIHVNVPEKIPTSVLSHWVKIARKLRSISMDSRFDAGEILPQIIKYNKNIEDLCLENCWSSPHTIPLPSQPLCNLLLRCPRLTTISLRGCNIRSCKFFKLLASRDAIWETRKRGVKKLPNSIAFYGSATLEQLRTFLIARRDIMRKTLNMSEEETKASLSNVIVNRHQIFDENDEDIDDLVEAIMLLGQEDQQHEVDN